MPKVVSVEKKVTSLSDGCPRPRTNEMIIVRYTDGTSKRFEFDYSTDYIYVYTAIGDRRGEVTGYLPVRQYKRPIQRCEDTPQLCEVCTQRVPLAGMRVLIDWRDSLVCVPCLGGSRKDFSEWEWSNKRGAYVHK